MSKISLDENNYFTSKTKQTLNWNNLSDSLDLELRERRYDKIITNGKQTLFKYEIELRQDKRIVFHLLNTLTATRKDQKSINLIEERYFFRKYLKKLAIIV